MFQSPSVYKQDTCEAHEKRQGRENKILPNYQIITACHIELRVQEITMNEKLTLVSLIKFNNAFVFPDPEPPIINILYG